FLEILEGMLRMPLRVTGEMDLPVLADDPAVALDEQARVEAPLRAPFDGELGVAEAEADLEPARLVEERLRRGAGHLPLEPGVELRLVVDPPVGEERGEGAFREDDEIAAATARLSHLLDEPRDDLGPGGVTGDRATLSGSNGEVSRHPVRIRGPGRSASLA